ncbi:Heterodisulfide reductase subunit A-like protein [Olavius algarvensis associated proteobacterium Delta 3]|nr:Heterodisulfide reductase subunit A-like protein [Olavius algarvensis associated proteobacterium Delta 3]
MKKKVGVYICQCGTNIAGKVDTDKIAEELGTDDCVAVCRTYKYMCSEPGQKLIRDDIEELGLDHVVEASCTPKMHEPTFRNACSQAGMNPYMFEMVNIREHCSWVSEDTDAATTKAKDLVRGGVARVVHHEPLRGSRKPVQPTAMVVGGGIAGITASLKIADAGYQVYLVEQDEIIGGRMAQFDKTFPTLDCAGCTLTPKTSEVGRHPNIEIMTKSQVESISGFVGNFKVKVRQQPRYVSLEKCTGCGDCQPVCPVNFDSAFEEGMATRHPISRAFPQAIPNTFSILRAGAPPCEFNCPAGVNAMGYMTLTGMEKYEEALDLVRERMPFAAICGRICFHPCETACKRGQIESPLSICATKRFLGDWELARNEFKHPPIKKSRDKKVAIIGSGPAGLSAAYYLALEGYSVTIFEKLTMAGGMLAVGIPAYRLPRDILSAEIDNLLSMGVTLQTGVTFGTDITYESLEADGYESIFVATGLHKSGQMRVEGEDLKGVVPGTDLLRQHALDEPVTIGKRVVVIGGGNVAVDCARTCLRVGAESVEILYRRTRKEMPAWDIEVEEAEKEGISLSFLAAPIRFVGDNGQLTHMEVIRMKLGEPDDSGRRRPVPVEGSQELVAVDTVVAAIGQAPEMETLDSLSLDTSQWGTITTDEDTLATSRPGVFAGGDCTLGAASFVEAVAHGRQAAESIHSYLKYGGLKEIKPRERAMDPDLTAEERLRAKPIERQPMPHLAVEQRAGNFEEVDLGLSAETASAEGQRCLHCGLCCQCGECARACGPQAIDLTETERIHEIDVGALIVATGIDVFGAVKYPEYGYGKYPDVITNLQYERLCNSSGPTHGEVLKPSDGKVPQSVVFIQCVGSRDRAKGYEYCSKVCCMISAKQLRIFKHHNPDGQAYVFYIDNRAGGKGYEEFMRQAIEEDNAQYIRGRVAKVYQEGGRLVVRGENSLVGGPVEVEADLVVLATGLVPQSDYMTVARALNLSTDKYGFFIEAHPKLGPVETSLAGIFLAGGAQGPKDIPESVAQGAAAGAEALALFGMGEVEVEPTVALVDERLCTGCRTCESLCPYTAVTFSDESKTAAVNDALCQGCGTCAAACPTGAIGVRHYTSEQICAQIEGMLG